MIRVPLIVTGTLIAIWGLGAGVLIVGWAIMDAI